VLLFYCQDERPGDSKNHHKNGTAKENKQRKEEK
jgi:hypothetical protein